MKEERILINEFQDELEQRAERNFSGRVHQAFIDWYIETEFGEVHWEFTDDANDGGIDAVIWLPGEKPPVAILQSKFTHHMDRTQLSGKAYREFSKVVDAFHHGDDTFDSFLSDVRDDLKRIYRRAYDRLSAVNNWLLEKKAFRLITTHTKRSGSEFQAIPQSNFLYCDHMLSRYEQYRKGATPKARPLELTVIDKLSYKDPYSGLSSYLFNARVSDFRKYLEQNDVSRLVARNIRYNLGGAIGHKIRKTYEQKPHDFWYLHNGLTIICEAFIEDNQIATVINPSVVNGAQSLYAISGSNNKHSSALVTTRVIVLGRKLKKPAEDDEWLQTIIRGVNTQNKVKAYDFRSNEPEQLLLQRKFRNVRIFYERKRGEWREYRNEPRFRNFERLSLSKLGQILAAVSDKTGHGVLLVRRGTEELFGDNQYARIFPSRAKVGKRFEKIYLAFRIYALIEKSGYKTRKEKRKQKYAFWNCVWLFHRVLTSWPRFHSKSTLDGIRQAFDRFESNAAIGRTAKKQVRMVTRSVWQAWRKASRSDPEHMPAVNFFKAAYGNRKILAFALPRVRPGLIKLSKYISDNKRV